MADGFAAVDYITNLRLSEVEGKRLWLVRVPRHIQTTRLEGTKLTLPLRKNREGKVLGRVTLRDESDEDGVAEREAFVLRAADAAESRGFRALFSTEEDDKLAPASLFAGQVNVSIESPYESRCLEGVSEDKVPAAALVEPYQGRPQLKGMRVRAKPSGAGSVYTKSRPATDCEPSLPPKSRITVKKEVVTDQASESFEAPLETPKTSKKQKKRKSVYGEGRAKQEEWMADGEGNVKKEEWGEVSASTTKKAKQKSRRKMSV